MTARERRALVTGGAALLTAWVGLRGVPAGIRDVQALRTEARDRSATLERARAVLAAQPADRDRLTSVLSAILGLAPELVDGLRPPDAQASLTGWLSAAAARHNVKVLRLDPLPDSSAGVFGVVAVQGGFEGDVRGLAGLLHAVEAGPQLLSVRSLAIDAADPVAHRGAPEVLHWEATVRGFYLPRGGAPR